MPRLNTIAPCLWFDDQAEQAAELYTSLFADARIVHIARYTEVGREHHGQEPGSVMTVSFELDGQPFTALNGGPLFTFSEAISLQIYCRDQAEVDHFWNGLTAGGSEQPCGWLKDRFGVSLQVVPTAFFEMTSDPDPEKVRRVTEAMFQMKKFDLLTLERAFEGVG